MPHFIFLLTDLLFFLTLFFLSVGFYKAIKSPLISIKLKRLASKKNASITFVVFLFYLSIAFLDSVHFQKVDPQTKSFQPVMSLLDLSLEKRAFKLEKTYSAPFASHGFVKEINPHGQSIYPDLHYVKKDFHDSKEKHKYIGLVLIKSLLLTVFCSAFISLSMAIFFLRTRSFSLLVRKQIKMFFSPAMLTFTFLFFLLYSSYQLSLEFHILGTGKIGQDVFYYGLKSIRTGLLIGLLTTLFMLPLALFLGTLAGLVGGKTDDVIQYIYITLSSVPGVLLIAAMVLSLQVFINSHQEWFPTLIERADARLLSLCFILGITSWTSLCRMLRAETLKLRELEYVEAARALGSSKFKLLTRHILPNVMHLVVIAVVLDFSFLVLAEAVLSYIGVGVSPLTISWGNMINSARLELAREPVVWWPMLTAFSFMFLLVLSVNLLSDLIRDEFDPKLAETF